MSSLSYQTAARRRWGRALVDCGGITNSEELRFIAFSLGELAADVLHGPVGFVHSPVPPQVAIRLGGRYESPARASGPTPLARASRRSGIVAVTATSVVFVSARTARGRLRPPVTCVPITDVSRTQTRGPAVAAHLHDGSVARFCFANATDSAAFIRAI